MARCEDDDGRETDEDGFIIYVMRVIICNFLRIKVPFITNKRYGFLQLILINEQSGGKRRLGSFQIDFPENSKFECLPQQFLVV
jgi:hypothetical protein